MPRRLVVFAVVFLVVVPLVVFAYVETHHPGLILEGAARELLKLYPVDIPPH
jgi:hypothetical protein